MTVKRVKQKIFGFTIVAGLMLISNMSMATDYYFSTLLGNDSRSEIQAQNPQTPWKTITKLNAVFEILKAGDAIYFRRGETFYGMINVSRSGASGNPIRIGAYGSGEKPIITGLTKLEGWKSSGNGIFEATHPNMPETKVNTVLFNGKNQEMGRYPNSDHENKGFLTYESSTSSSITSSQLNGSYNWTGAEVVIKKVHWIIDRHPVVSQGGQTLTFSEAKGSKYTPRNNFGFFIQNHLGTLDKKGEWYYDTSLKKLSMHFGQLPPEKAAVEVSFLDHLIVSNKSVSHLVIDGLELKGANSQTISFIGGSNIQIKNCKVAFSGETGIYLSGTKNVIIEKNEVLDSHINGIFLGGANNARISENKVLRTFLFPGLGGNGDNKGAGIFSTGDNTQIDNNEVINSGYIGIRFGGENAVVSNNFVNFFCLTKNDGGGIYAYTGNRNTEYTNRKIVNNIILNGMGVREGTNIQSSLSKPQVEGIYLDDNTSGVLVSGNTIAHNSSRGIFLHNARNISIENNLIYNNHLQVYLKNDHLGDNIRNINFKNNLLFTTNADQNSLRFWSKDDDISQMGNFENNNYSNPFSDDFRISTVVNGNKSQQVSSVHNLTTWQESFNQDINSYIQPINIFPYELKNENEKNKFINGAFDQNANFINCVGCESSWDNNSPLDGGALKVAGSGSFNTTFDIGNVVEGKHYIIRFSAIGTQNTPAKIYFQERGAPWTQGSSISVFEIEKQRKEYEILLTGVKSLDKTSLLIRMENVSNADFKIDNLGIHEVDINPVNPEGNILFEYNSSNSEKTIFLKGEYMDMKGKFYRGSIPLAPFNSVILIKAPKTDTTTPQLKFTSPKHLSTLTGKDIELMLEVEGDSSWITTIDYYSNQKLLGSASADFLTFTWENVPEGIQHIHAVGWNEAGKQCLSDTVQVSIAPENLAPVIHLDKIISPIFMEGEKIFISSTAIDLDGKISKVQFYEGNNLLATITSGPYEFNWENMQSGNYQVYAKATDNLGLEAYSDSLVFKISEKTLDGGQANAANEFALYLNTGSSIDSEFEGEVYLGDKNLKPLFENGYIYSNRKASEAPLYQSERNGGNLQFSIPVPNGTYQVKTMHNELWFGHSGPAAGAGRRVFDITIEGEVVKKKFDLFIENKNQPMELIFESVEVKDGQLNIDLTASSNRASISGLAIIGKSNKNAIDGANLRGYREMGRGYKEMDAQDGVLNHSNENPISGPLTVNVFPNPAKDLVNLTLEGDVVVSNITIHDMGGQLVQQVDPYLARNGNQFSIPLNRITNGVYLISIWNSDETIGRHRLIVNP